MPTTPSMAKQRRLQGGGRGRAVGRTDKATRELRPGFMALLGRGAAGGGREKRGAKRRETAISMWTRFAIAGQAGPVNPTQLGKLSLSLEQS